jgi:hypothetical protein
MTPAGIEGPKNTGALIVISVKSAHHLAAMSAGKLAPNPNANFPSKNKLHSTSRQIKKLKRDTLKPAYFILDLRFQILKQTRKFKDTNPQSKIATLTCFYNLPLI